MSLKSQQGFSLLEALVAGALLIVITMGFLGLITAHQKEVRRMTQKLALQDVHGILKNILQDSAKCTFNMLSGTLSLNTAGIPANGELQQDLITTQQIRNGSTANSTLIIRNGEPIKIAPGLTVTRISLTDWSRDPSSADLFLANLEVGVQSDAGPVAPLKLAGIFVRTDPATPAAAKTPLSCGTAGGTGPFQGVSGPPPGGNGSYTGVYTATNTNSYPIFVTASGGNNPNASGDNKNTCHLAGPTGVSANNNQQWGKSCFIAFWVAPGATFTVNSNPWPPSSTGAGVFNVMVTK